MSRCFESKALRNDLDTGPRAEADVWPTVWGPREKNTIGRV